MTLTLFVTHGAMFIALKTDGDIRHRARDLAVRIGAVAAVLAVVFLVWTQVKTGTAGSAVVFVVAALALVGGLARGVRGREGWAFVGTFVTIALAVAGLFVALFPDVMPSTTDAAFSLTTTNAAATAYTLKVMTWVAVDLHPDRAAATRRGPTGCSASGSRCTTSRRPSCLAAPRREAARPARSSATCGRRAVPWPLVVGDRRRRRGWLTVAQAFAVGRARGRGGHAAGRRLDGVPRWASPVWCCCGPVRRTSASARRPVRPGEVSTALRRRLLRRAPAAPATCRPADAWPCWPPAASAAVEPYLTRYLPALVAGRRPARSSTLAAIAWLDPLGGLIVALTLPLVPVFAALVGLTTRDRAPHASGGARGALGALPRRRPRAADAGRPPPRRGAGRHDPRRSPTATAGPPSTRCGSPSPPRSVLELVATLSVALVAVTRRASGWRGVASTSRPR